MTVVDLLRDLGEFFPLVFDHKKARHPRKHFPDFNPPPPLPRHPHDVVHKVFTRSLPTRFRPLGSQGNWAGFYLGYLSGRSFPLKKNAQLPPKYIVILTVYKLTISEKSSRRDEVSAHTVTFLKIVSQNAPDCISAHIHLKKISGPP